MSRRNDYLDAKVYVGGLPEDATSQELEDAFHRFGRIRKVWVARRPPGFAFIEFEDARDAEDAVKSMDGNRICGVRARVELSHGRRRNGGGGGGGGGGGFRGGGRGGGDRGDRRRDYSSCNISSTSSSPCLPPYTSSTTGLLTGIDPTNSPTPLIDQISLFATFTTLLQRSDPP